MKRRVTAFLLGLVMAAGLLTGSAFAAPCAVVVAEDLPAIEWPVRPRPEMPAEAAEAEEPESVAEIALAADFAGRLAELTGISGEELAPFSPEGEPLTRYRAGRMLRYAMNITEPENRPIVSGAPWLLPDYDAIPEAGRQDLCEILAMGLLPLEENGAADPEGTLTSEEADKTIARFRFENIRTPEDLEDHNPYRQSDAPNGHRPFALWLQEAGVLHGVDTTDRFCELMFGEKGKYCFESYEEAAPWMVCVTLDVWMLDENGEKYPTTMDLRVHKYVAADVYDIFREIFADEERFPIELLGCAGFNDDMRHSWCCAIDINSEFNAAENNEIGRVVVSSGKGWWPEGTERTEWAGLLREDSPYSIRPDSSVVRIFAKYGWGWGGSWTGCFRDFMHFSILPDGG